MRSSRRRLERGSQSVDLRGGSSWDPSRPCSAPSVLPARVPTAHLPRSPEAWARPLCPSYNPLPSDFHRAGQAGGAAGQGPPPGRAHVDSSPSPHPRLPRLLATFGNHK